MLGTERPGAEQRGGRMLRRENSLGPGNPVRINAGGDHGSGNLAGSGRPETGSGRTAQVQAVAQPVARGQFPDRHAPEILEILVAPGHVRQPPVREVRLEIDVNSIAAPVALGGEGRRVAGEAVGADRHGVVHWIALGA